MRCSFAGKLRASAALLLGFPRYNRIFIIQPALATSVLPVAIASNSLSPC